MRPLPTPPDPLTDTSAHQYGLELFRFVIREGVTATLTDDQLELATHASLTVVSARDASPRARERYRQARRALMAASQSRANLLEPASGLPDGPPVDRPTVGPMAPLAPNAGDTPAESTGG